MRGSPGKVTEALMFSATTDSEREEESKAKDDKQAAKEDQEAKKSAKKDAPTVDAASVDLPIGSIVITTSVKDKARFNNFKSQVISHKKNKVRVKFLEGPALGTSKDLDLSNVTLFVDESDGGGGETEMTDEPAKRRKMASELFGTTM
jgi:hypothetical protein